MVVLVERIIESATARVELFQVSSSGEALARKEEPLQQEILKLGAEFDARFAPPDYAVPVAMFYPSEI